MGNYTSCSFSYVAGTFIVAPVIINDSMQAHFVLDTGIGLTLISEALCRTLDCPSTGTHVGKRMSGQEISVPLCLLKSLTFATIRLTNTTVGVFDVTRLMPGQTIEGFLSVGFFRDTAFTTDYNRHVITIESDESLRRIKAEGTCVPVRIDDEGDGAAAVFLPLTLPNGDTIFVEVDTGSQALILDERFMVPLNISRTGFGTRQVEAEDETGHQFIRYFSRLNGRVHVARNPSIGVDTPEVMFQKIIYDGLVGHSFLSQFIVTYNLPNSEMIFRNTQVPP